MKKTVILSVVCTVLAVCCIILSVSVVTLKSDRVSESEGLTTPLFAGTTSVDTQFRIAVLHLLSESNSIVTTLPYTTIQISSGALIKAFANTASASADANAYIDNYYNRTIDSAFATMDDIIAKFEAMLTEYGISLSTSSTYSESTSSEYADLCNSLTSKFASLKNSSDELMKRTRALINKCNSSEYDDYYTKYAEQVSELSSKVESYGAYITENYNTLLKSLSKYYDKIK